MAPIAATETGHLIYEMRGKTGLILEDFALRSFPANSRLSLASPKHRVNPIKLATNSRKVGVFVYAMRSPDWSIKRRYFM